MIEKISLEQFREYKAKIEELVHIAEKEEIDENTLGYQIFEVVKSLSNYDLSNIPSEEWNNMILFAPLNESLDFSRTKANIDFINTMIGGNINLKGCNILNLDKTTQEYSDCIFDDETKRKFNSCFLSDIFPKEIREKYARKLLSKEDLASFSLEQIQELSTKDCSGHFYGSKPHFCKMVELLGVDKAYELSKDKDLFDLVFFGFETSYTMHNENLNNALANLRDLSNDEIESVLISTLSSAYNKDKLLFLENKEVPRLFVNEANRILLKDVDVPEDVRNRYINKRLTVEDVITYIDIFGNDSFLSHMDAHEEEFIKIFNNNYKEIPLYDKIVKYKKIIADTKARNSDYMLSKSLSECDGKASIDYAIKDYLKYYKDITNPDKYNELLSSLGYTYKTYNNLDDLLSVGPNTILSNEAAALMVDKIGIQNLLLYARDTGLSNNTTIKTIYEIATDHKDMLDVFSGSTQSFEEFKNNLDILVINYRNSVSEIGFFEYESEDLSLPANAPRELIDKYKQRRLTVNDLENPEYIPYIQDKKLGFLLKNPSVITSDNRKMMLYDFLEEKLGRENTIKFIHEVGPVITACASGKMMDINENSSMYDIMHSIGNFYARRLLYGIETIDNISPDFKRANPTLFVDENAPAELQEIIKNRECSYEFLSKHKEYLPYVKDLEPFLLTSYLSKENLFGKTLYDQMKDLLGDDLNDFLFARGQYIEKFIEEGIFYQKVNIHNKNALVETIDNVIISSILENEIDYDESLGGFVKDSHPEFFLAKDAPLELKEAFYNKTLDNELFISHPEYLEYFNDTELSLGFKKYPWIRKIKEDDLSTKENNEKILMVVDKIKVLDDKVLENELKTYIIANKENLERLDDVIEIFKNILVSNSSELYSLRGMVARELVKSENPVERFKQMEKIFVQNNLPTVGKVFLCFKILHPDYIGLKIDGPKSKVSPVILSKGNRSRDAVIFSDLMKCTLGSNNRNISKYLDIIMNGTALYEKINSGEKSYDSINEEEKILLNSFATKLEMLYRKSFLGKVDEPFVRSEDSVKDITELKRKLSPDGSMNYKLDDRIIKMYLGLSSSGLTCEEVKAYMKSKVKEATERSTKISNEGTFEIKKGALIKGVGDERYLGAILQNGSVAKEYLGSAADSDNTPLDTDVSMVDKEGTTIDEQCEKLAAMSYGPVYFIINNDERFSTTRADGKTDTEDYDSSKMELFQTGVLGETHYGIRTGFASSDIDAIYVRDGNYHILDKTKMEIAKNGIYIPIINNNKKVIFSREDFDKMRESMRGMSEYDEAKYRFSPLLENEDVLELAKQIEENNKNTQAKREVINAHLKEVVERLGYTLKTREIDGDLTEGSIELIDTGSTGRGTNAINDGDFDFMVRLDRKLLTDKEKLEELKSALREELYTKSNQEKSYETDKGDFRYKEVKLEEDTTVDLDLSFTVKTDKISYSTDMALKDRLENIKKQDPEKYNLVVANILLAKKVLKDANVYKPNRGDKPQGGLGGVGVENWILQNGGSFVEASLRFLKESEKKSFDEFKAKNHLWDYGENHMAAGSNRFLHDDFYSCNMSGQGFLNMRTALKKYLGLPLEDEKDHEETITESISEDDLGKSR